MNLKRLLLTLLLSALSFLLFANNANVETSNNVSLTMEKADYQIIVDYVNTNLSNSNDHPSTSEDHYGASAYYSNFDIRSGKYDASFATPEVAISEALGKVFLPERYASSALDTKYEVMYKTYSGSSTQASMRFVCSSVSPLAFSRIIPSSTAIAMDSLDYQSLVNYVNEKLTNTHAFPSASENYYGASAYYKNFNTASGSYASSFDNPGEAIATGLAEAFLPFSYPEALKSDTFVIAFATYSGVAALDTMTFICSAEQPVAFSLVTGQIEPSEGFENLKFGTDSTFDVITWNIEHFPKNGTVTMSKVKTAIMAMAPEVIAFQEIDDTDKFSEMISELEDYEAIIGDYGYAPMCFIYKKSSVTVNEVSQLFSSDNSSFPREPLVLDCNFGGEKYVIIGNHLKCCGDGTLDKTNSNDEEYRRYSAINILKTHIDTYWAGDKVIVVGDFNDVLEDDEDNNIFLPFINDSQNYVFADMAVSLGDKADWSYPSWPSDMDHILITNELFENSTAETIKIDDHISWSVYEADISDHRPVGFRVLTGKDSTDVAGQANVELSRIAISPNPVDEILQIDGLSFANDLSVMLYSNNGNLLLSQETRGRASLPIDMTAFNSGIYLLLVNGENTQFSQKVIKN